MHLKKATELAKDLNVSLKAEFHGGKRVYIINGFAPNCCQFIDAAQGYEREYTSDGIRLYKPSKGDN